MNRKILLLNLTLLALAGLLGWRMYAAWGKTERHEREVLTETPKPPEVLPPPAAPAVRPATPADYIDVAQRTLFSRDRDPNVIVIEEKPPPPPPPPPMPELPRYFGQMALGEPVVVLSTGGEQKSYRAGEKIGEFTVVGWDQAQITLNWDGKEVVRNLDSLRPPPEEVARAGPRRNAPAAARGAVPQGAAPQGGAPQGSPARGKAQSPASPSARNTQGEIGKDDKKDEPAPARASPIRTCSAGDNSPDGTVKDGYKKVVSQTLMGTVCHWEQVN